MKDYAIRIKVNGELYRFATHRLTIEETIGGESYEGNYLPLVTQFEPAKMEVGFESGSPVPTLNVGVWDGVRDFMKEFRDVDYESAEVTVFFVKDRKEVLGDFRGYMTDVDFGEGVLSFTVRMYEDAKADGYMSKFTPRSFQYFQIMAPREVDVGLDFTPYDDCPWTVASGRMNPVVYGGASIAEFEVADWQDGSGDYYNDRFKNWDVEGDKTEANAILPLEYFLAYIEYPDDDPTTSFPEGNAETKHAWQTDAPNTIITNIDDGSWAKLGSQSPEDPWTIYHEPLQGGYNNEWQPGDHYKIEVIRGGGEYERATTFKRTTAKRLANNGFGDHMLILNMPRDRVVGSERVGNYFIEWTFDPNVGDYGEMKGEKKKLFPEGPGEVILGQPHQGNYRVIPYEAIGSPDGGDDDDKLALELPNTAPILGYLSEIRQLVESGCHVRPVPNGALTDNYDRVYIRLNGFYPFDPEADSELSTGFIDAGQTYTLEFDNDDPTSDTQTVTSEIREIYRFKMIEDIGAAATMDQTGFAALEIHNHSLPESDKHEYALSHRATVRDLYGQLQAHDPLKFLSSEYIVGHIDFHVDNTTGGDDLFVPDGNGDDIAGLFVDRLRGLRFDMMRPLSSLVREGTVVKTGYNDPENVNYKEFNGALLGQASGKFGVCISSELRRDTSGNWFERCYFSVPTEYGSRYEALKKPDVALDENGDPAENPYSYTESYKPDGDDFVNTLRFKRGDLTEKDIDELGTDLENEETAEKYFHARHFRVVRKPVPENGADLGSYFPLAYGHQYNVPMMQAVSKKVMLNNSLSAGDDLYIYAANKCAVESAADIDIVVGKKENEGPSERELRGIQKHVVHSPFPKVLDNHYEEHREVVDPYTRETHRSVEYVGKLYDPYHKVTTAETRDGQRLQAVKLRGGEWNWKLGSLDRRFAIRNGVGSSVLYASFAGQVDEAGRYIERGGVLVHPLDILDYHISTYGEYPFGERLIDRANIKKVKAQTPHYEASVFMTQPWNSSKLIEEICHQFGFFWYMRDGKLQFGVLDIKQVPDWNNPLCYNLNLGNKVSEGDKGYQKLYNRVVYEYRKNRITDTFEGEILLNASNNEYCRRADKAKGQASELSVQADFVHQPNVARDVVTRLARVNSSRKISYKCEARYDKGISFYPGQFVPMTYPPYDIVEEPVMIKSIKEGWHKMELEVVRFPNIFADVQDYTRDIVPSKSDDCSTFFEPS